MTDKQIKKLQQQLDQLKAEKEEIKKYLGISSKTIMERLEELQQFRDNDKYKLYQAEQTFAEIKETAEKVYNDCNNCYRDTDTNYEVDCIDCTLGGKAKLAEQILQLINGGRKCKID